ncbi:hypothetical protein B0H13DRAFT_1918554 [Mycena leptocephala]|nr:hypothetical protein B0H13DRAFT_1918554 [Mycena leptocephala]
MSSPLPPNAAASVNSPLYPSQISDRESNLRAPECGTHGCSARQRPSFGNIRYHLQENSFDLPRNTREPQVQRPSTDTTKAKCLVNSPVYHLRYRGPRIKSQGSKCPSHNDNSPRIPRDLTDVSGELTRKQTAAPPARRQSIPNDNSPRIPRDLTDVSGELTRKQTAAPPTHRQSIPSPWMTTHHESLATSRMSLVNSHASRQLPRLRAANQFQVHGRAQAKKWACRATFSNSFSALVKMTTHHESLVTYASDELTRKQTAVPGQYLAARRLECPATP